MKPMLVRLIPGEPTLVLGKAKATKAAKGLTKERRIVNLLH